MFRPKSRKIVSTHVIRVLILMKKSRSEKGKKHFIECHSNSKNDASQYVMKIF
jgi:hypothetical protein